MPLPEACPGLVFRYEYVWKRQALAGLQNGEKERPACVVLTVTGKIGDQRVLIVPITTKPPDAATPSQELPIRVRRHLGLDGAQPCWLILDEANIDTWPSPDMRQIPGKPGCFAYGLLPLKLVNMIRQSILASLAAKRLNLVHRQDHSP